MVSLLMGVLKSKEEMRYNSATNLTMNSHLLQHAACTAFIDSKPLLSKVVSSARLSMLSTTVPLPPLGKHALSSLIPTAISSVSSSRTTRTTSLCANGAIEAAALGFFSGIRIPAALIAGSALSAFFTRIGRHKDGRSRTGLEVNLDILYHVFSLISLLLSLNVVITATAAGTTLLLDKQDSLAKSAFDFLKDEMYYEFLMTRWSFFTSLLAFIGAVTTRALLDFDLIRPSRRKGAWLLLLSVGALVTHVISFLNETLYSSTNLLAMTWAVMKLFASEGISERKPLECLSFALFLAAWVRGIMLLVSKKERGQLFSGEHDSDTSDDDSDDNDGATDSLLGIAEVQGTFDQDNTTDVNA